MSSFSACMKIILGVINNWYFTELFWKFSALKNQTNKQKTPASRGAISDPWDLLFLMPQQPRGYFCLVLFECRFTGQQYRMEYRVVLYLESCEAVTWNCFCTFYITYKRAAFGRKSYRLWLISFFLPGHFLQLLFKCRLYQILWAKNKNGSFP